MNQIVVDYAHLGVRFFGGIMVRWIEFTCPYVIESKKSGLLRSKLSVFIQLLVDNANNGKELLPEFAESRRITLDDQRNRTVTAPTTIGYNADSFRQVPESQRHTGDTESIRTNSAQRNI